MALSKADVKEYLAKYEVGTFLQDAVQSAVDAKSTDPLTHIAEFLLKAKSSAMAKPQRTRSYMSHHFDCTMWDEFKPRKGDIFVCTAYKSGTTWMQQIVSEIVFKGEEPPEGVVADISPWVDLRVPPKQEKMPAIEAIAHRRFLKTHLPLTCMPYYEDAKYVYVGRDGRDAFMSMLHHWEHGNDFWYGLLNDTPNRVGPEMPRWDPESTPSSLFEKWLKTGWSTHEWETDGWPWWSLLENFRSYWEFKHLPNILFVHFGDLKKDLAGQMRRIADFLGEEVDESKFADMVEHCTFDYMKSKANNFAPVKGEFWEQGGKHFFNKGTNGRWKDALTEAQSAEYEAIAAKKLGADGAKWLAGGGEVAN